MAVVDNS